MQPKDLRLATERDLENSIGAATAPLDQRLEDLEVSAGFTPGDINDTTAASLIRNPESETATELSAAIVESVDEGGIARPVMESAIRPQVADSADVDPDPRVRPNTLALSPALSGPGAGNAPGWLSRDRTTLFSVSGARHVRYSLDSGATWTKNDSPDFDAGVTAVRDLDDGEILVFTGNPTTVGAIWKSDGWSASKTAATFTRVKTASAINVYFHNGWSISVHGNIVLAAEYGSKVAGANARYLYLSTDYGATWSTIYTLNSGTEYHLHGVAYDKWWKRIWLSYGDISAGVLYSDDLGATWKTAGNLTGAAILKCTTIVPMKECILFLTDTNPNGVWRAPRTSRRDVPVLELAYRINSVAHITHLGYTAYRANVPNAPYLLTFGMDSGGTGWAGPGLVLATTDGYTFHEIWRDEMEAASGGIASMVGPTTQGKYVGYSADARQSAGYTMVSMAAPNWTVTDVRERDWFKLGDETMPRLLATGEPQAVTGRLLLTYLTATENAPVTQVVAYSGSVGAGADPTLCRWGIYEVQQDRGLKLVASTPNVPTRFANPYASIGGVLSVPFQKVAGRRYAIGALCVNTGVAPMIAGAQAASSLKLPSGALASEPRISGRVDGLSDLPEQIAVGDILGSASVLWASLA